MSRASECKPPVPRGASSSSRKCAVDPGYDRESALATRPLGLKHVPRPGWTPFRPLAAEEGVRLWFALCSWITVYRDARCHTASIQSWAHRLCSASSSADDAVCVRLRATEYALGADEPPNGSSWSGPRLSERRHLEASGATRTRLTCGVLFATRPSHSAACCVPRPTSGRQAPRSCLWWTPGRRCSSVPPKAHPPLSEPASQRSRLPLEGSMGSRGGSVSASGAAGHGR
ncbi:Hypothetical protein GLP15_1245 [Giardia lamblia P15]|uniref:Uncharacterized protein n=1 Tax=Giardia intestinalis (strain P15) TaxID=658858 RepID=E1EZR6_GIAIA|nr:Hypothetical protein GLP15_1245 [Giardia lamblia P15]